MDIVEATKSYEQWMRSCTTVIESHLRYKHEQMEKDLFLFLRGTYYRWAQLWPEICPDLCKAPCVLSSADLHVNSFGTWRDSEGRLAWGVDDFDESYPLPYTHDLVRLAASLKIVIESKDLTIKLKPGCEIILIDIATHLLMAAIQLSWPRTSNTSRNLVSRQSNRQRIFGKS
jgi:uncharacterized protein (DUF2252 family)